MGLYRDKKNKFNIYDAPKVGGTTIRSWILYSKYGKTMLNNTRYKSPTRQHYKKTENIIEVDWFREVENSSICIKRDPVERFVSCYKDKILRENRCNKISIDKLIDNFESIMTKHKSLHQHGRKVPFLWYHFAPQAKQFGTNFDYYEEVFDLSEINTRVKEYLEDMWKINLPCLHTRKGNSMDIQLSDSQKSIIKNIYDIDYKIGWS